MVICGLMHHMLRFCNLLLATQSMICSLGHSTRNLADATNVLAVVCHLCNLCFFFLKQSVDIYQESILKLSN